ncbi:MAG: peptidylprolyl isomerase [Ignavibacteria bacterium]|nr:peptidylprolyl isomerase [Ignavibacteria bacterium]
MKSIFSLFIIVLFSSNFIFSANVSLSDTTQKKSKKSEQKSDMVSVAVIETKFGKIEIELFEKDAPKTTANFIGLANQGYFNGIIFHRISKNFVIQGGDPTGTGSGGKSIYGGQFEDELNPNTPSYKEGYKRGVVAMANAGPNTNTSQFFIMLTDRPTMPKLYTIFGKVIKGMDVVDKIAEQPITPVMAPTDGKPVKDIVMKKVYIEKRKKAPLSK